MKILHIPINRKWFDMILSGEKKEEYREAKPHWLTRIYTNWTWVGHTLMHGPTKGHTHIMFSAGYGRKAAKMLIEFHGVSLGLGNPNWGAPEHSVLRLKLGEILETKNC